MRMKTTVLPALSKLIPLWAEDSLNSISIINAAVTGVRPSST